jgi:hypothetical protein
MRRLRRSAVATTALVAAVLAGTLFAGQDASTAETPKVQVVAEQNLDAQGLVRVHEQGTANVNVTGTPLVNLGPGANGVRVTNPNANPVPVRDVDTDSRERVNLVKELHVQAGEPNLNFQILTVPLGKRFVIEYVDARVRTGAAATPFVSITTNAIEHNVVMFHQGDIAGADFSVGAQVVSLYAEPQTLVSGYFLRSPQVGGEVTVSLSGYLVDV